LLVIDEATRDWSDMNSQLTNLFARTRQQELRAAGAQTASHQPRWAPIAVRLATAADRPALERLAELDSASRPSGSTLIGSISDRPVAALSLGDGQVFADPFARTCEVVELLRLRARQMRLS
jgi:hypothetical protein